MSQNIFSTIIPSESGTDLATMLNAFKDAIVSGLIGPTRPTELQAGGMWVDNSADPVTWVLKLWTGSVDVVVISVDLATSTASVALAVDSFMVKKVSADTVGAILNLVKNRIASSGQVKNGDVVGEVRWVGRTDSATDPVVAKILYTAGEDETTSSWGGTLSFQATPTGMNALVEHFRFIGGLFETVVPHKTNGEILSGQNVASAATISALDASKILVELTGSTVSSIQGLDATMASKVVHVHNRTSVIVTLSNQDAGATAANRLSLPDSRSIDMNPQDSVALYYCTADLRWKILYASARFTGFTVDTLLEVSQSWAAPSSTSKARIIARSRKNILSSKSNRNSAGRVLDVGKNLFMWGDNLAGGLGDGTTSTRTVPTLVLESLKFIQAGGTLAPAGNRSSFGLTENGTAYMWGRNVSGELGDGTTAAKSSPVAVLGGHQFVKLEAGAISMLGLTASGAAFSWGLNISGELGVGDVTPRSSPVAVLGGFIFRDLFAPGGFSNGNRSFGLGLDGAAYAWGINTNGELGLGDQTSRSSPVAVVGGLFFKMLIPSSNSTYGITTAGALYAWGKNSNGQLGDGTSAAKSSPVAVAGGLVVVQAHTDPDSQGSAHVLAIDSTGAAFAFGINDAGQLGDNSVTPRSSPVAVAGGLKFQKVIAAQNSSYGLTQDGSLYAWGFNDGGQLGDGTVVAKSSPVAVAGGLSFVDFSVIRTALGPCVNALTWDGKLYAWGWSTFGELGDGTNVPKSSPVAVAGGLSLRTQDDSDTIVDISISGGTTYPVRLGAGPCFFGSKPIGNDIYEVEVSYVK